MADARADLRADCSRCVGLCCVAPAFAASADFAIDKPAGRPCPKLRPDSRCSIHSNLREQGFPGCAVFDCFGAGQHVVQVTFGGGDWRQSPETAEAMFAVFPVMRQLKELLWYLAEALTLLSHGALRDEVQRAQEQTKRVIGSAPDKLRQFDAAATGSRWARCWTRSVERSATRSKIAPPTVRAPTSLAPSSVAATFTAQACAGPT